MKHYYALFTKTDKAIEVEFPDLEGCVTFGKDWEEALENAEDVLAAWLTHAEDQFIKEPSNISSRFVRNLRTSLSINLIQLIGIIYLLLVRNLLDTNLPQNKNL